MGTYPLPESQLDRFIVRTGIGYPPEAMERSIIKYGSLRNEIKNIPSVLSEADILVAKREVHEQEFIWQTILSVTFLPSLPLLAIIPSYCPASGPEGELTWLMRPDTVAYLEGRDFVIPEDLKEVIVAVGSHRLITNEESQSLYKEELLRSIVKGIQVPLL